MENTALTDNFEGKGLSAAPYLAGSIFVEGYGSKGAKPHPFNLHLAVRQYHHWAYGAAKMRAQAAAGVPLRMFARRRDGRRKDFETRRADISSLRYLSGKGEFRPSAGVIAKVASWGYEVEEVIEPHPAMKVLGNPNPNESGYEMAVNRFLDQQICGNFWWYVRESSFNVPMQLFRLPPQWTTVKPNVQKTGDNRVSGYVYGKNTANEVEFSEQEVDHFRTPNPKDAGFFYGMGWYEACWQAIGLHNAKRTEDLALKQNFSRPDWMLSVDGGNQQTLDRLESKMKEKYRGVENSGKFMLMAGKIDATALQWEMTELGTPTRLIEEIAFASETPVSMMLANDANRSGGDSARLQWYRTTVRSDCLGDEQKLNQRYLPRFDGAEDYLLCYDHVSFEDHEAAAKRVVSLTSGGIISPNEARQELGYQDAKGADLLYPPAGNTGGSAHAMGNLSPQQNPGEPNGGRKAFKAVARMPAQDMESARDESQLAFTREIYKEVLKDPTAGDAAINLIDVEGLTDEVGLKRREGVKMPILPIVTISGPVVTGEARRDGSGSIIGGEAGTLAPESIAPKASTPPPNAPAAEANGQKQ